MHNKLQITSDAFQDGGPIPATFTGDGEDISPPLKWDGLPDGTKSLALIVDDPDAPDPENPQRTWVHWVLYNIPPGVEGIREGAPRLPEGTKEGLNDWERTGYGGPNPPKGRHRYFHKLYALDAELPDLRRPTKAHLEAVMKGHILAQAEIVGTYEARR